MAFEIVATIGEMMLEFDIDINDTLIGYRVRSRRTETSTLRINSREGEIEIDIRTQSGSNTTGTLPRGISVPFSQTTHPAFGTVVTRHFPPFLFTER